MAPKLNIPKEDLEHYYLDLSMTLRDIAKIYNCAPNTIHKYLVEYNISRPYINTWTADYNKRTKKKYNQYDLSGPYGVGVTYNTGKEFLFDLEDYDKIKDVCWSENDEGYMIGRDTKTGKIVKMHDVIMDAKYVDHITHNKNDNRKSELRVADDLHNSHNRKTPSNNKSGHTGVCWKNREQKWYAYIKCNGKYISLGTFDNIEDAINKRIEAENKYYKEWSYENSINKTRRNNNGFRNIFN